MDAKRAKTKAARERRQERIQTKRNALAGEDDEAEEPKEVKEVKEAKESSKEPKESKKA